MGRKESNQTNQSDVPQQNPVHLNILFEKRKKVFEILYIDTFTLSYRR